MEIVRAGMDDCEAVSALFDAYRVFYGRDPDLESSRAFIRARLERGDSVIFLARDADGALGFTQLYPCFSSVSAAPIWILNDLYTDPEARKHGVGTALLRAARDFGRETGALRLELATAHTNHTAQALYEAEGYVLDTVFRRYSLPL